MPKDAAPQLSPVEQAILANSPYQAQYPPTEKMPVLVVKNFPTLGKFAALRFIEWVQDNPGGVISLPTGKTPEHFIKWVERLLQTWDESETRSLLEKAAIDPSRRPDMKSLHFVQIDEFYPIHSSQHNSFHYYVNDYYLKGFGLDPRKALLIDCEAIGLDDGETLEAVWPDMQVDLSLRVRPPHGDIEKLQQRTLHRIDQWCQEYEARIRERGGIGFFLGGIGPDGHVGFNVRGSDHFSTTRLTPTNYETQAAAATDLGGIEVARKRLVITIGLGTITYNPKCTAIILAAGEAKAGIISDAVQSEPTVLIPGTALHSLPGARCYTTRGAAKGLVERRIAQVEINESVSDRIVEKALVDLSVRSWKRLTALSEDDAKADSFARQVLAGRSESLGDLSRFVRDRLADRINKGARSLENTRFLHTEPHHDDIMLGYLPYVIRNTRSAANEHFFATMTSGFTAVTNHYLLAELDSLKRFLNTPDFGEFLCSDYYTAANERYRNRDVWQYLDGVAAADELVRAEGSARRLLRNLIEIGGESDRSAISARIEELRKYLKDAYPGKKDSEEIQLLKGMRREWEAECLWGYLGWKTSNIFHMRLGFYTGDIFTQDPSQKRDVEPILRLLRNTAPDLVTVAFDPEASGPDTHYKVLQAVHAAVAQYADEANRPDIRIWGYRNVWFRFEPHEADIFVPVSIAMLATMDSAFLDTYVSQKEASFPSYEHDGPFCHLARRVQVEQYQAIKTCLGREWFHEHPSALIRATRGLVFLREMSLKEFGGTVERLRKITEDDQ